MVILDITKPDCCNNCPCYCGMDGYSSCAAREYEDVDGDTIPEWCPMDTLDTIRTEIHTTTGLEGENNENM